MAKQQLQRDPVPTPMAIEPFHSERGKLVGAWISMALMYGLMGLTIFMILQKARGQ